MKRIAKIKSFTLLETIIAIIIVTILVGVGVKSYLWHIEKAKSVEAIGGINIISKAEEMRKLDKGNYVAAPSTEAINQLLGITLTPRYYDFEVVGVTNDDFVVIARRIGANVSEFLEAGLLPPTPMVIAGNKSGLIADGYQPYIVGGGLSGGSSFSGGGSSGGGSSSSGSSGDSSSGGSFSGGSSSGGSSSGGDTTSGGTSGGSGDDGSGGSTIGNVPPPVTYDSTIQGALDLLGDNEVTLLDGKTTADYLTLISDEEIGVISADFDAIGTTALAFWVPTWWLNWYPDSTLVPNTVYIDQDLLATMPTSAIAAVIVHELTHADYNHNESEWVDYTLAQHPELESDDLTWLTDPVTSEEYLYDSHDQEFNAFVSEILVWKAVKGTDTDSELDYVERLYDRDPADLLDAIERAYPDLDAYQKELGG